MKKKASLVLTLLLALSFMLLCTCSNGTSDVEKPGTESPATLESPTSPTTPTTPTYAITITPTGAAGSETVVPSVTTAPEGTTITLTATLGAGRRVALSAPGVTITPATISTNNGTATFVMPGAAVTVTATFSDTPVHSMGYVMNHTASTKSFNMHYVPSGGTFIMGEHVESTTQTVTLTKNFWMGETEVTQGLWEAVWGATWPGTDPDGSGFGAGPDRPAYYVSWYDAVAFCNLLTVADGSVVDTEQVYYSDTGLTTAYTKENAASGATVYVDWTKKGYRLPTEAEWEYAARYIDGTSWNGGDHVSGGPVYTDETDPDKVGDYAWYSGNNGTSGNPDYSSKDVGQKTANALGLRDMSGNVWEWCYDWYAAYSGSTISDPTGPTNGSNRVYRGGAWGNLAGLLLCAYRNSYNAPTLCSFLIGFRLCRTGE